MNATIEPHVGIRLRTIREQQGFSLRTLGKRCGLSINAISLIERGENSPTVSTLHRLAMALNVPITTFFQEDNRQKVVFTPKSLGLRTQYNGTTMESLGIGLFNQQLEPFRMVINPGVGIVADPIAHSGEEFIQCVEGVIEYLVGDRKFHLEQGDSLLFDATQQHAYHNPSQKPTTILVIFQATIDDPDLRRLHMH